MKYQFWDGGTGTTSAYFWTPNNSHWSANTTIEVTAADVSEFWVRAGSSGQSETMWVRAFDGTAWSNWDSFTLTTVPNTPPVVAVNDQVIHVDNWAQVSNWINYTDGNGDAATKYQFWDSGTGISSAYFWTPDNSHWAANAVIEMSAAELSNVWVKGGNATGSETLWVRAFDGYDWGNWDSFTLNSTNAAPVATIADHSAHTDQWVKIDSWLTATDSDNDAITVYQFWDSGTPATSGYFWTPANSHWSANTVIDVSASDIGNVWLRGGSAVGSETLWVRAFDGHAWGLWDTFTFNTTVNTAPVAAISDQNLHVNAWTKPQDWLSTTDAEGDTITDYQFWDGSSGAGSGYFWTPDNSHWAASTTINVSASELPNLWIRAGSSVGAEMMYVRAFDGAS
ncbi:hypothetical protein ML401_23340 [Bradyrhizobium sp. 62B]|uniref:hypothetical protein n=1 Tax=Bradyrhizobium sp. 62B TaxID=2898442 RepID=UPI002557F94A|nr:hypothetical protein ML401_23340 [Bradyrhizobium sp. 62B]